MLSATSKAKQNQVISPFLVVKLARVIFLTFHNEAMNVISFYCIIFRFLLKQIINYFSILIQSMNKLPIIVNLKPQRKVENSHHLVLVVSLFFYVRLPAD